jgi:hypothetical protein
VNDDIAPPADNAHEKQSRKRRRGKQAEAGVENEHRDADLDMSTSPELPKSSAKKRKKEGATVLPKPVRTASPKQSKKAKSLVSSTKS